jgi:putative oxidoreductase
MPMSWSLATLLVRIVMGFAFILHGYPKITHPTTWLGTHALTMPSGSVSFVVPPALQATAAVVEFFGGWALVFGILTRAVGILLCGDMIVALLFAELPHHAAFVAPGHDLEPNLIYMVLGVLFFTIGPGALSLDAIVFAPRTKKVRHRDRYAA